MASFVVTYPVAAGATFDAGYYVDVHMPLVRARWTPYGLESARALIADGTQPYAAVALLDFRDGAAIDAALASDAAAEVFGDVANFTTITPVAMRAA